MSLKYVSAYLMMTLAGKKPTVAAISETLDSVGAEVDKASVELLVKELEGKDIKEVIASGMSKLSTLAVAAPGAAAAAPAAAAAGASKVAETKAESEKAESADEDLGFNLFD
eukprot:GHVU01217487.1.p3 GENE.GHVU01217487.1~~GHVU01217487.1.p3  ORF type:complete len:112 (+),score=30.10 GHVU01217487.1:197-532(+)